MSSERHQGFLSLLNNPAFVRLWLAETIGLSAQNGIHFAQMVAVEHLTGSTTYVGFMILAFSLPGVLFSTLAGVVVDRLSKKTVLVVSNFVRALSIFGYVLALKLLTGWQALVAMYLVTFVSATLGQFLAPAMWAKVPLIVGESNLLAANALFNLTSILAQGIGLLVLVPLAVKFLGIPVTFLILSIAYMAVTGLAISLPPDRPAPRAVPAAVSSLRRTWHELREGLAFVVSRREIAIPMGHVTLIATLLMVMGMMAPGFAARVLGMSAEDAVYIFSPAGVGMALSTAALGRWGRRLRRETWANLALMGSALAFGLLGYLSRGHLSARAPLFEIYPGRAFTLTMGIMAIALLAGFWMATLNTVSQTTIQERSPSYIRGRVYSVQFLLSNLIGIPPMLGLGAVADTLGIPTVCFVLTGLILITWLITLANMPAVYRARVQERCAAGVEAGRRHILILASQHDRGAWNAGLALQQALTALSDTMQVTLADVLDYQPAFIQRLSAWFRRHAGAGSWLNTRLYSRAAFARWRRSLAQALLGPAVRALLQALRPEAVLCLDPMLCHLCGRLRRRMDPLPSLIAVIPQLVRVDPLWAQGEIDWCVVPTQMAAENARAAGIPPAKVHVLGLPIHPSLSAEGLPKDQMRRQLGWDEHLPAVLVVCGRRWSRSFWECCRALAESRQAMQIVIAGVSSPRRMKRLKSLAWQVPVRVLPFVEHLPAFLRASDVLITRAGSSILAEALAARVPVLLLPEEGQDDASVALVVGAGCGAVLDPPAHVGMVLAEWLRPDNPLLAEMAERAGRLADPHAAVRIAAHVLRWMDEESGAAVSDSAHVVVQYDNPDAVQDTG
jgi:UDP-N-acetylglucosamine:LPS N-acetylglucosamine transferase